MRAHPEHYTADKSKQAKGAMNAIKKKFDLREESGVLRLSLVGALLLALAGIAFGLVSGSFSILFDGFYSLMSTGMSVLLLAVSNLITAHAISKTLPRKLRDRFSISSSCGNSTIPTAAETADY